jgi:predicted N-acetyltransferase YhbS
VIERRLSPPTAIAAHHNLDGFTCGEASLDEWLRKRALRNHASGASRCFVVCAGADVVGYYRLSAGAIAHAAAPKSLRRNMPDPLPALVLGRLAVDRRHHNRGLGSALLRDAMTRSVSIAGNAGVSVILLHALSDPARQFYLSRGFQPSPLQPMTLLMTLETLRAILLEPG